MADLTKVALWWASTRGVAVFPVAAPDLEAPEGSRERRGKYPLTTHGLHDGTTDPEEVRAMFLGRNSRLVGGRTGMESGFIVVDLDVPFGQEQWVDLQAKHGDAPQTFTVSTMNGGRHLYFRAFEGAQSINKSKLMGTHIDVKAEGGYVVLPGSPGYEVIDSTPPAQAPEWLRELITRRPTPEPEDLPQASVQGSEEDLDKGDRYTQSALDQIVGRLRAMKEAAVPDWHGGDARYEGEPWDATHFAVACQLLELANSPWNRFKAEEAFNLFLDNTPRDRGWGQDEVIAKWQSAVRTVKNRGRPKPAFFDGKGIFDEDDDQEGDHAPRVDPNQFFRRGEGLDATLLAQAILDMGPLAVDNTASRGIWRYEAGVYSFAPYEIRDRCVTLLQRRFYRTPVETVTPVIQKALVDRGAIITCDPTPDLINTRSGMLEWRTGRLREQRPDDYSTVQLPVQWRPEARCPNFDRFLAQVMAPDALDYIWEIIGYLVMSGNPLQKAILFHGDGGNGKGTLIRVLQTLLGTHNTSSVTLRDISDGKFETASLYGKIANLAGDIDASYLKSTAKFKAITGEDMVDAQRKYQAPFQFRCWAVPVFSANRFWKSADATKGYQRRWVLVPFPNRFENPTLSLSDTLARETDGILVKAVEGLRRLMERGNFDPPLSARLAQEDFATSSDQVKEWLRDDEAVVHADPGDRGVWTPSSALYRAYRSWAEMYGMGPLSISEFRNRLEPDGYHFHKNGVMRVHGIRIDLSRRNGGVSIEGLLS